MSSMRETAELSAVVRCLASREACLRFSAVRGEAGYDSYGDAVVGERLEVAGQPLSASKFKRALCWLVYHGYVYCARYDRHEHRDGTISYQLRGSDEPYDAYTPVAIEYKPTSRFQELVDELGVTPVATPMFFAS